MFRNKLLIAFSLLGLATVFQAGITVGALKITDDNVQRGRVANELYAGFIELLSQKHQLRLEITNSVVGLGNDPQQREVFFRNMLKTLNELDTLAKRAYDLHKNDLSMQPEHQQRMDSIRLLRAGVLQVGEMMETDPYMRQGKSIAEKQQLLNTIFDITEGQDLRAILFQSISRERLATERDRASADVSLRFMNNLTLTASALIVLIVLALARYFYGALNRPIRRLTDGASALRGGDLSYRIPEFGRDEFTSLARSMNEMASEISRLREQDTEIRAGLESQVRERTRDFQDTLHRLEKVDLRRKQMFADISHELRTPTTAIKGEAEITLRYQPETPEEYQTTLRKIVDYTQSLSGVIDDMLTLARSDIDAFVLERRTLHIAEICQRAVQGFVSQAKARQIKFDAQAFPQANVLGDEQRLEQVLRIGLDNALNYCAEAGDVTVQARLEGDAEGLMHYLVIIRNTGKGISKKELSKVFDRHYRGSHAQLLRPDGSGLGLALAKTIIRAHRGHIHIESVENEFTELTISLPVVETTHGDSV